MFKLVEKFRDQGIAKFHVLDRAGSVVGSINIPPEEIETLLKQWSGAVARSSSVKMSVPRINFSRAGRMSRQAILRGCL
jgi:hypothetical protein